MDDLIDSGKILEADRILTFKLGLDQSDETREPRDRVRNQLLDVPTCAWDELGDSNADQFEKLITIYLTRFWADAKNRISQDDLTPGESLFDNREVACSLGVLKYVYQGNNWIGFFADFKQTLESGD